MSAPASTSFASSSTLDADTLSRQHRYSPIPIPKPDSLNSSSSPWQSFSSTITTFISANTGLAMVCLAQLFFCLMNITVKYSLETTNISVTALIAVRMSITGIFCIVIMLLWKVPDALVGPPGIRWLLALRGCAGCTGILCMYQSLKGLSVSDSVSIGFLVPSVTVLLGVVLLKESVNRRELITLGVCLIGVTLVSRPAFLFGPAFNEPTSPPGRVNLPSLDKGVITPEQRALGVMWSFAGVFCAAAGYTTIRFIGKSAHALHSMLYFSYISCALSFPVILIVPGEAFWPDSWYSLFLITLVGVFGFTGQVLVTLGLQREKAGRASLAIYTSVVFALILELLIFHTLPSFMSVVGVSIIVTSAVWVAAGNTPPRTKSKSASHLPPPDEQSLTRLVSSPIGSTSPSPPSSPKRTSSPLPQHPNENVKLNDSESPSLYPPSYSHSHSHSHSHDPSSSQNRFSLGDRLSPNSSFGPGSGSKPRPGIVRRTLSSASSSSSTSTSVIATITTSTSTTRPVSASASASAISPGSMSI